MKPARLNRIAPDPMERLRRIRGDVQPDESKVRAAARRVLASDDGKLILGWMIAQSYGRTLAEDAPESALRANEVRKRFLDQFLALAEEPSATADTPAISRRQR